MRKTVLRAIVTAVFALPLLAAAGQAARLENPYFSHWASLPVGKEVTGLGETRSIDGVKHYAWGHKLLEVHDDYVVLENERVSYDTNERTTKTIKLERYLGLRNLVEYGGTENVTVNGQVYSCEKYTIRYFGDSGRESLRFEYWFHPDIPGFAKFVMPSLPGDDEEIAVSGTETAVMWTP